MSDKAPRFVLADALRGIAATGVVFLHVCPKELRAAVDPPLPAAFVTFCKLGQLGVYVFFVLSGFVIAHSVFETKVTLRYFGKFTLRRSLRLDPPYWATIALAVAITPLLLKLYPSEQIVPSWNAILANCFYLQEFLGMPHVIQVFWTLCLEIQFYLVFVACLGICQWLERQFKNRQLALPLVMGGVWVSSLLAARAILPVLPGLFLPFWPLFFLGVVTYWAYRQTMPIWLYLVVLAVTFLILGTGAPHVGEAKLSRVSAATATALVLFLTGRTGRINTWSGGRGTQFLGKISYSLYLTHVLTAKQFVAFVTANFHNHLSPTIAYLAMAGGVICSILGAFGFYLLVEQPSHNLSRRISLRDAA